MSAEVLVFDPNRKRKVDVEQIRDPNTACPQCNHRAWFLKEGGDVQCVMCGYWPEAAAWVGGVGETA